MDRNDLLAIIRGQFLREFSQAIDEWLHRCGVQLTERASLASGVEQRIAIDANKALRHADKALKQHLSNGMANLIERGFETAYDTFRPSFANAAKTPSLSLLDTGAVESELRLDSLSNRFRNAAETDLRDLNIRVARLFGQAHIHERENPFRPYMFARCIVNAVDLLELETEVSALLTETLGSTITDQVIAIYAQLNDTLAQRGIDAELQLVIRKQLDAPTTPMGLPGKSVTQPAQTASSAPSTPEPWAADQRPRPVPPVSQPDDTAISPPATPSLPEPSERIGKPTIQQTLQSVFVDGVFINGSLASGSMLAFKNPAERLEQTLNALLSTHAELAPPQGESMLVNLITRHHAALSAVAGNDAQRIMIDIVGLLFEFILHDELVPLATRVQLARMQLLTLKVSLLEPDLLTHPTHPLRVLIDRMAAVSLGFEDHAAHQSRVLAEVARAIDPLLADRGDNPALVKVMLDRFETSVRNELEAEAALAVCSWQAYAIAGRRTERRDAIKTAIVAGMAGLRFTPYVQTLLQDAWPAAIEKVGRTDHALAERYLWLVPELIWSIAPKTDAAERKQLLTLIPHLLPSLKSGLAHIGWTTGQLEALQRWLVDTHKLALQIPDEPIAVPSLDLLRARFEPHFKQVLATSHDAMTSPSQAFLTEVLQELGVEVDFMAQPGSDLPLSKEMTTTGLATQASAQTEIHDGLVGVAMMLALQGNEALAQLSWVSADRSAVLLRLTGAHKPLLITAELFAQLREQGQIRFIETAPLFERAIDSLLNPAESSLKQP